MDTIVTKLVDLYKEKGGTEEIQLNATIVDILAKIYKLYGGTKEIPVGATTAYIIYLIIEVLPAAEEIVVEVPPVTVTDEVTIPSYSGSDTTDPKENP